MAGCKHRTSRGMSLVLVVGQTESQASTSTKISCQCKIELVIKVLRNDFLLLQNPILCLFLFICAMFYVNELKNIL